MIMHNTKAYIVVKKTKVLKNVRLSAYSRRDHKECMCHKQFLPGRITMCIYLFYKRYLRPSVYLHI